MTFRELAQHVLDTSSGPSTPVLITPRGLTLRSEFLIRLADQIHGQRLIREGQQGHRQGLRFDWMICPSGRLADIHNHLVMYRARRINSDLRTVGARIEVTTTVSRPTSFAGVVIGWCDEADADKLPSWTRGIRLRVGDLAVEQRSAA